MENIKQKIIAVIILILVVAGLIWLTMFLKNKNTDTETGEKTGIALFTKKNPGTKQVKNQGSIGSENDSDLTGNDTTKPVSIIENIIQTITGNNNTNTSNTEGVSVEKKGIGQAIRDFFLGNDGLPAGQVDTQVDGLRVSEKDPLALIGESEPAFIDTTTEEDDSIGRECAPKVYVSKITRKNELEEQIKTGKRKKETLSDIEQDLLAWKPSGDEIDEDNMRRVLERNWDMWSYPTSYLKDCQWTGYEQEDASQVQNEFDKAKRQVRDTFSSISIMVGSQYTYQEAQNFLLTTRSTIDRYKDTISDCRLVRGLFEDPSGTTTGVTGYAYNWNNEKPEDIHKDIRLDIAKRVKNGDLKNKIKNDSLRAELGIEDPNANQSALSTQVRNFSRDGKKIVAPENCGWGGDTSIDGQEQQFCVLTGEDKQRKALDTDTWIKNRGGTLYEVCHYDQECGTSNSIMATNNFPGIYMVRLPQSIWDILRQDRSKNLFCTLNNLSHQWAFQEWEITRGEESIANTHVKSLNSYGIMCDNNFIQDDRITLFRNVPTQFHPLVPNFILRPGAKVYTLNPYYDLKKIEEGVESKNLITLPNYTTFDFGLTNLGIEGNAKAATITTQNRDNWYSLDPIKARYDFFKDDE